MENRQIFRDPFRIQRFSRNRYADSHDPQKEWENQISHSQTVPRGMFHPPILSSSIINEYHQDYTHPETHKVTSNVQNFIDSKRKTKNHPLNVSKALTLLLDGAFSCTEDSFALQYLFLMK